MEKRDKPLEEVFYKTDTTGAGVYHKKTRVYLEDGLSIDKGLKRGFTNISLHLGVVESKNAPLSSYEIKKLLLQTVGFVSIDDLHEFLTDKQLEKVFKKAAEKYDLELA